MLTSTQEQSAKAIVNLFETGSVLGDYGKVTLIPGDSGQLTYGRSQTTLASGGLHALIRAYSVAAGALLADDVAPFLPALEARDRRLNGDRYFHNLLRAAADDPVMRSTQDRFFDEQYWQPAARAAGRDGLTSALGAAVVYDSWVHGSWSSIRARTNNQVGVAGTVGERRWVAAYVQERRDWLAHHRRADLRRTVYRMNAFQAVIRDDNWDLDLPLVVRGQEISEASLNAPPPGVYDGPLPRSRPLQLTQPIIRGLDVRLVQVALSRPNNGQAVDADGLFGRQSERAVRAFQGQAALPATGVVDDATFDALRL